MTRAKELARELRRRAEYWTGSDVCREAASLLERLDAVAEAAGRYVRYGVDETANELIAALRALDGDG